LGLSLSAGSLPGSKHYSITLTQPVQVGSVKLAAGDYKLKVDGATATFISQSRKQFTAPVKVEQVAKKAPSTAVETKDTNGTSELTIIDIGGADFKLVF
jgi:hexokinase